MNHSLIAFDNSTSNSPTECNAWCSQPSSPSLPLLSAWGSDYSVLCSNYTNSWLWITLLPTIRVISTRSSTDNPSKFFTVGSEPHCKSTFTHSTARESGAKLAASKKGVFPERSTVLIGERKGMDSCIVKLFPRLYWIDLSLILSQLSLPSSSAQYDDNKHSTAETFPAIAASCRGSLPNRFSCNKDGHDTTDDTINISRLLCAYSCGAKIW